MISCKYISFLQDFVNFKKLFDKIKTKELLKEGSKGADVNKGKFVLISMYCLLYNCFKSRSSVVYKRNKTAYNFSVSLLITLFYYIKFFK